MLRIVETLNQKGVEVKSLKEQLDTSTPQGKFMLTIFGANAEFERDLMLHRQRDAKVFVSLKLPINIKDGSRKSRLMILTTTKNFGTTIISRSVKLHGVLKFAALLFMSGSGND